MSCEFFIFCAVKRSFFGPGSCLFVAWNQGNSVRKQNMGVNTMVPRSDKRKKCLEQKCVSREYVLLPPCSSDHLLSSAPECRGSRPPSRRSWSQWSGRRLSRRSPTSGTWVAALHNGGGGHSPASGNKNGGPHWWTIWSRPVLCVHR